MRQTLKTWLQLFRAPNLLTVPGDPLAGFLLASAGALSLRALLPVAASVLFYAGGLLLNDLLDFDEDARDRPQRPLPSGNASKKIVWIAASALFLIALIFCAISGLTVLRVGAGLLVCIVSYNAGLKKFGVVGPLTMGLCRGLSLCLGSAAAGSPWTDTLLLSALLLTLYIAAVTNLARHETTRVRPRFAEGLPCLTLVTGGVLFAFVNPLGSLLPLAPFTLACLQAGFVADKARNGPLSPLPPQIGALIRNLLLLQSAFCMGAPGKAGVVAGAALIVLWPMSKFLGKRFAAS